MKISNAKVFMRNIFLLSLVLLSGFYIADWKREKPTPMFTIKPSIKFEQISSSIKGDIPIGREILEKLRFSLSKPKEGSRERFLLVSSVPFVRSVHGLKVLLYYKDKEISKFHLQISLFPSEAQVLPLPEGILDLKNLQLKPNEKIDERFFKIEILSLDLIK